MIHKTLRSYFFFVLILIPSKALCPLLPLHLPISSAEERKVTEDEYIKSFSSLPPQQRFLLTLPPRTRKALEEPTKGNAVVLRERKYTPSSRTFLKFTFRVLPEKEQKIIDLMHEHLDNLLEKLGFADEQHNFSEQTVLKLRTFVGNEIGGLLLKIDSIPFGNIKKKYRGLVDHYFTLAKALLEQAPVRRSNFFASQADSKDDYNPNNYSSHAE